MEKEIAPEFGSWPMNETQALLVEGVRKRFDECLSGVAVAIPEHNARYLALVKTKLEEACMFAVKGIAKPE